MSTPLTAPKPDMPTGSSNPVSWKSWFAKIGDWINGLSPSGATVYDTGWVNVTTTGVTVVQAAQVRRVGKVVHWRGEVSAAWTTGNTAAVATGGVPSQFLPGSSYRHTGSALGSSGAVNAVGTVGTDGAVSIRATSAATGAVYLKGLSGYLVD